MTLVIDYFIPFLIVLSILVFVHEWGHYWVGRRCGVRVETFSIGFGPEIAGWTDRVGTRWKVSAIPLGGYVKFFGDADAASRPDPALSGDTEDDGLTEAERAVSFPHKPLGARTAVVAAGPLANFLFAVILLAGLYAVAGSPYPKALIGDVEPDSPAALADLRAGDRIVAIDDQPIGRFVEIAAAVRQSEGAGLDLDIHRATETVRVTVVPQPVAVEGEDGTVTEVWRLGIVAERGPYGPVDAVVLAVTDTVDLTWQTLVVVGRIIIGAEDASGLGGPIRIAQMSGDFSQVGIAPFLWFMAILSINLGLINLFPVPMLDGGHLLFYAAEAVRGRPLGPRVQEYGFRIGLALVLALVVFVTWNDLVHLEVFSFLRDSPS